MERKSEVITSRMMIRCESVTVAYGRQEVVRDVCLEIPTGRLLPFVGPNGAGKTTLLRAILGLLPLARGVLHTPFARKPAGYVPQQKAIDPLYPVTLRQIVEMGLYPELGMWGRLKKDHRRRVDEVLVRFGLEHHQEKTFGELSGGMKQKALLGRALVSGADVFVLDEPTSELDEDSERDVLRHLLHLARHEGKTVLMAHHGLDQAGALAEQVCVVHRGQACLTSVHEARICLSATACAGGVAYD